MKMYEKPVVLTNDELAEGVYAASGGCGCDSKYMNGVWQAANYTLDGSQGYKAQYGCLGCPANTDTACGLLTHYKDANQAESYGVDTKKHKPAWEWLGFGEYEVVNFGVNCGNQSGEDKSL